MNTPTQLSSLSAFFKCATYQSVKIHPIIKGKRDINTYMEISKTILLPREIVNTISGLGLAALATLIAFHFLGGPLDIDATTLAIAGGSIGGGIVLLYAGAGATFAGLSKAFYLKFFDGAKIDAWKAQLSDELQFKDIRFAQ
jgi:hypothetical protein